MSSPAPLKQTLISTGLVCAADAAVERAVMPKTLCLHHFFIFSWKVRHLPRGVGLSFSLPPRMHTPLFLPSIWPPASTLCGQLWLYGTNTSTAPQSYFKSCCLCCLLAVGARSEFPSGVSTRGCGPAAMCHFTQMMWWWISSSTLRSSSSNAPCLSSRLVSLFCRRNNRYHQWKSYFLVSKSTVLYMRVM